MDLAIRPANETDVKAVYELICELENTLFPEKMFSDLYKRNLDENRIAYLVAGIDEKVVAFGSIYLNSLLHHCGQVAEIQELIVSSTHRKKSIGSQLLKSMINWAKQQGVSHVEVTSNRKRTNALAFYQENGFTRTHEKLVLQI